VKLSLIHATRGRKEQPIEAYRYRADRVSGKHDVEYIFSCDGDDHVGVDSISDFLAKGNPGKLVVANPKDWPRLCHVTAMNLGYKASRGDIIVQGDDDVRCMQDWDAVVVDAIGDPKVPAVLGVGDPHNVMEGHRPGAYGGDGMLGSFIATRAYCQKQGGFLAYPEYDGMQCDFEFTQKAALDEALIDCYETVTFSHFWPGGMDDPRRDATHNRHMDRECHNIGYEVLGERQLAGSPDVRVTMNSNAVDEDYAAGRLAPPHEPEMALRGLNNRKRRGFSYISTLEYPEGSARWHYMKGHYAEARALLEPLIKRYHLRACGGRFLFHGGLHIWNECTKVLKDRNVLDCREPLPF